MSKHFEAPEVLLVEDNPNDVELTLRAFKQNNVANRVNVVGDGEEALEFLRGTGRYADTGTETAPPKVILLDLKLPRLSGLEVLREIKADPELRKIPVVVLTASREENDVIEAYDLGVNSYIVKPVDFAKFLDVANNIGVYWLMVNEPPLLS